MLMYHGIGRIFKLLRHIDLRVLLCHPHGNGKALVNTVADVSGIMDQDHLRPVMPHQFSALLADGIRHDDDRPVSPDRPDQRQADALIAAGGLHNNGILLDQAFLFRLKNHVVRRSGLNRASYIQSLEFYQHLSALRVFIHPVQTHHRRMPDSIQYISVYHCNFPLSHSFCSMDILL